MIALDGTDLRAEPLAARKRQLADLLRRRPDGILRPFETGAIGPSLFVVACRMNLEGLVSKHNARRYRPRTCEWVKVKNRAHPAFMRVLDSF